MALHIPLQKRITDLETLKVLSNPLRLRILEYINSANQEGKLVTVKQIARQLDQSITKLYYHINLLEAHDLIAVEETHIVSGILEKHYRVSALRLSIEKDILEQINDPDAKKDIILSLVETILEPTYQSLIDFFHAKQAGKIPPELKDRAVHLSREIVRINLTQAEEFHRRLSELVSQYEALTPDDPSAQAYTFGLTTLFYPVIYEPTLTGESDKEG